MASQLRCQVEVKNLQIPPQRVQANQHRQAQAKVHPRVQAHRQVNQLQQVQVKVPQQAQANPHQ